MNPEINILILNWNGKKILKSCIDSLKKIKYSNFIITVIDNGSTDKSLDIIKKDYKEVKIVELEKNHGYSGGYNNFFRKINKESSDYFMLLNNDTEVDPNILNEFNKARLHFGDNNIYGAKIFYHNDPNKIWYAGGKVNLKYAHIYHVGIRKYDNKKFSIPTLTDYVTGCCLFTSKNVLKKLNGFDEEFKMYGEDVDLCIRAKKVGINCYYWPEAILWHHISASTNKFGKLRKYYLKILATIRLINKQRK